MEDVEVIFKPEHERVRECCRHGHITLAAVALKPDDDVLLQHGVSRAT